MNDNVVQQLDPTRDINIGKLGIARTITPLVMTTKTLIRLYNITI